MKFKKFVSFLCIVFSLFVIVGFLQPLTITNYEYTAPNVPSSFEGFRILQLSDFHCKSFGKNEQTLIQKIQALHPDLILFTGDMVDEAHAIDNFQYLVEGISDLAPIYAVTGNHDTVDSNVYTQMLAICEQYGVHFLDNDSVVISQGSDSLTISGTRYTFWYGDCMPAPNSNFNVLLYHDSNAFPTTSKLGYDLIFSGHSHGGIVRLPFIGGLISNDRTLFPKYAGGVFTSDTTNSTMYSNRGLGDTEIPRFYNSPEIVVVTLHSN